MKTTINKISKKKDTIDIHEKFISCAIKSLDSKHRIALGDKQIKINSKMMKIDSYRVFVANNGDILLKPYINVPVNEAWLYQDNKLSREFHEGLEDAKAGRVKKVNNLNKYLKEV
ncbi:MAG: hypothetical protein A2452_10020 [Candidatus Firestonebacteria bacterium RIFOXYC2_FULL_39_67]|nr:MAG: hypothetical protein A2536_04330 [Candidatus Firestonebacteria bacterium RIFOXYD2_FULL_39_29]OGF55129.1 MAG: hypothetical protein A2452_10020 [Candidatus Firestonebacteria bacterium RIFOXYC2_FULL_39_67]